MTTRPIALLLLSCCLVKPAAADGPFVHPGLLHRQEDFDRMKQKVGAAEPWNAGWERLVANRHSSLKWKPRPQAVIYRGLRKDQPENYTLLYNDIAAAYALGLRWKVSGDHEYADKAIEILNATESAENRETRSKSRTVSVLSSSPHRHPGVLGYSIALWLLGEDK